MYSCTYWASRNTSKIGATKHFKGIIILPTLELLDVQGMPVGTSTPADGEGGSAEKEDGKRKNHAGH